MTEAEKEFFGKANVPATKYQESELEVLKDIRFMVRFAFWMYCFLPLIVLFGMILSRIIAGLL